MILIVLQNLAILSFFHSLYAAADINNGLEASGPLPAPTFDGFEPLLLSKYIENGHVNLGRERSKVKVFSEKFNEQAYSGYITIQTAVTPIDLYFLHFESRSDPSESPLLLWFPEKPGQSTLFSQFGGNGPIGYKSGRSMPLFTRQPSLNDFTNVIYLDQSAGCGYSRSVTEQGLPKTMDDIVQGILLFLEQFLLLFPVYRGRKFYLGGDSYGARVAVAVADVFAGNPSRLMLQGIIAGSGFLGPLLQLADSSEYLHQVGMLNRRGRAQFQQRFAEIRNIAFQGDFGAAYRLLEKTIFAFTFSGLPTLFQRKTGYKDYSSALQAEERSTFQDLNRFFHGSRFQRGLNIGVDANFQLFFREVSVNLIPDYFVDFSPTLERVLDRYEVLAYSGQFDVAFPVANMESFFAGLKWAGTEAYASAKRSKWRTKVDGKRVLLGYVTRARGFTQAVLRRAGHLVSYDVSPLVVKLIEIFMNANRTETDDYPQNAE